MTLGPISKGLYVQSICINQVNMSTCRSLTKRKPTFTQKGLFAGFGPAVRALKAARTAASFTTARKKQQRTNSDMTDGTSVMYSFLSLMQGNDQVYSQQAFICYSYLPRVNIRDVNEMEGCC